MKFKPPFVLLGACALLTNLLPLVSPSVQAQGRELRKVRVLLVIDTSDRGLAPSVNVDKYNMRQMFKMCLPSDRYELTVLEGADVNRGRILGYYSSLRGRFNGDEEALFFFYAGHGATDNARGHYLDMGSGPLVRSELLQAMKALNPATLVVLTDCCSNVAPLAPIVEDQAPIAVVPAPASSIHPALYSLLFKKNGVIDITAAKHDTSSWGDANAGGVFTRAFVRFFCDGEFKWLNTDKRGLSWKTFFANHLELETRREFEKMRTALGGGIEQTEQAPHAFSLGTVGSYRFGGRVVGIGNGMKVLMVHPNTPLERCGLEVDDVILSINGTPLRRNADFIGAIDNSTTGQLRLEVRDHRTGNIVFLDVQMDQ